MGRDDDLRSLEEVAILACSTADADESLVELADPPVGYAQLIESLDTDRLRSLGWRPEVGLEDGIRSTLDRLRESPSRAARRCDAAGAAPGVRGLTVRRLPGSSRSVAFRR